LAEADAGRRGTAAIVQRANAMALNGLDVVMKFDIAELHTIHHEY
jgi:hypothetical protein